MNKLFSLLHSRKGETMVEILVSMLIVVMLLGCFGRALNFASNSLRKSGEIRNNISLVKEEVRKGVVWPAGTKQEIKLVAQNERSGPGYDSKQNAVIKEVEKRAVTVHDVNLLRYYKEVS